MYSTIAIDPVTNDIYLDEEGNIAMHSGIDAISDICRNAAQTVLGEMRYAVDQGVPYFDCVFNGVPNLAQFEAALRLALLNVNGVSEVVSIQTSIDNNILTYFAVILTDLSDDTINITGNSNV